jgi:hypothetical protein
MSILLLGLSECPICHKIINEGDNYYMFPHFVVNRKDPLYFVSDDSCHVECLLDANNGKKAIRYRNLFIAKTRPENRKCIVSGELITRQEDHCFIGYLTSNKSSNLHRFNFTHINKLNLAQWAEREYLVKELAKLRDSGEWHEGENGKYLDMLINELTLSLNH